MKPLRRAVALAIRNNLGQLLVVKRPPTDPELPGVWGLPATVLREGETETEAAERVARGKLSLEVRVEGLLSRGRAERESHVLEMSVLRAAATTPGGPKLKPPGGDSTFYVDWRWADELNILWEGAARGSLCCSLLLESGKGVNSLSQVK